ncbi:hypothetical protein B5P43_16235 [Bacillus sp. SRB_336]|nr:hypothetical protein B5P43_16235 [Bacillus sp. SRB_336]
MIWPKSHAFADSTLTELTADEESLRRWEESLDALQQEAEAALAGTAAAGNATAGSAWAAPTDLGPLPGLLLERARSLAGLQEQAVSVLAEARTGVEHELAALVQKRRQVRPVYVDVAG